MNDTEAFLRKIRENPDDDAPRLVFADYLDEQAQKSTGKEAKEQAKWAALIRAGIAKERESTADASYWNKWAGLSQADNCKLARDLLPKTLRQKSFQEMSRGFYDSIEMGFTRFVINAQEIIESNAPIRAVKLFDATDRCHRIAGHPVLGLIRDLDLSGDHKLASEDVRGVCSEPQLRSLTGLAIDAADQEDLLNILKKSHNFPNLRRLRLDLSGWESDSELMHYPIASQLELYNTFNTSVKHAELLSHAPLARTLTNLDVSDFEESPPKKIKWGSFQNLQSLTVWQSSKKDWVTPFLESQDWQHLNEIELRGDKIPDDALSHFESGETEFSLKLSCLSQTQLKGLLSSGAMKRVKALKIWASPIPSTVQILSKNESAINLRSFEFEYISNRLKSPDTFFKMLCKSPVFANLVHLKMTEWLSLQNLKQLADSALGQSLRALECIHFSELKKCEAFLRDSKNFPNLVSLSVYGDYEIASGWNIIAKGRKKLELEKLELD